jgi:hypothetical protein
MEQAADKDRRDVRDRLSLHDKINSKYQKDLERDDIEVFEQLDYTDQLTHKGKSAIKVFDRHLELKRGYWGRHFWAKGYA